MASTYSPLKIELIGTGEQAGTWGVTTNTNLGTAIEEALVGSADVTFASADVTLTLTDTNATQIARHLRLKLVGTSGGARNLILGSGCQIEKPYLIDNTLADAVTVKNTTGTGIIVPPNGKAFVYNDGTNVVDAVVASGGGGITYEVKTANYTAESQEGILANTSGGAFTITLPATPSAGDQVVVADAGGNWGTNNLTIGRNGSTIEGAAEDLVCNISNVSVQLIYSGTTWEVYSQIGASGGVVVTEGATQTLTNKTINLSSNTLISTSAQLASSLTDETGSGLAVFNANPLFTTFRETTTISATAATGTVNYDAITQSVIYYTSDATGNWTLNIRGDTSTTLNSIMSTGQSLTIAFLVTIGATQYRQTAFQIDGSSVTPKWQGGTAPTAGNISSIDMYTVTIVKTGNAAFTAFESQTQFK
jgi:hypothetical protein